MIEYHFGVAFSSEHLNISQPVGAAKDSDLSLVSSVAGTYEFILIITTTIMLFFRVGDDGAPSTRVVFSMRNQAGNLPTI